MSDTYNPDELLKCKHLTEFARQLNIKLDGGTLQRNITWRYYDTTTRIISDINQPVQFLTSSIKASNREFDFQAKVSAIDLEDTSRVIVKNFSTTDTTLTDPLVYVHDRFVTINNSWNGLYDIFFRLNRVPQTVDFDVFIAANAKYLETNQHVTLVFNEG